MRTLVFKGECIDACGKPTSDNYQNLVEAVDPQTPNKPLTKCYTMQCMY